MSFFGLKKNAVKFADSILPDGKLLKLIAPLPDLEKSGRVLFIGPHPDDIEIGAGATLDKFVKAGKTVKMIVCTDGGAGSADCSLSTEKISEKRAEEQLAAAKYLNVADCENLGFPDGGIYSDEELSTKLAQAIFDFAPDLVICPDPQLPTETHPDHLKCARAAVAAVTVASNFYSAQRHGLKLDPEKIIPTRPLAFYFTHRANVFVKIRKENVEARLEAIKCHESQFSESLAEALALYLSLRDKEMGKKACGKQTANENKIKAAEGFFAMAPMHQHCTSEPNEW